jgi:hypothetical protein
VLATDPSGTVGLLGLRCFMKDIYEILRQKELAIERVRKEIAALQVVVSLLADDGDRRRPSESTPSWRKDA